MIGFFFKKNFYDGWDNVISLFIPNFIFDAVLLLGGTLFFIGTKLSEAAGLSLWLAAFFLITVLCSILILAWAESAKEIANYEISGFKEFFEHLKTSIFDGIKYGVTLFFLSIITLCGVIYYFKLAPFQEKQQLPFIGLLTGCIFCWIALSIFSALFWYPHIRATYHNTFFKSVKKCFVLMLDNLGKNIVMMFYNVFLLLISIVMLGAAPGMAGLGLARANFLRLLLKKYDYLEELAKDKEKSAANPRRKIPWRELLEEDIEITGTRTFKTFFMPWKHDTP